MRKVAFRSLRPEAEGQEKWVRNVVIIRSSVYIAL